MLPPRARALVALSLLAELARADIAVPPPAEAPLAAGWCVLLGSYHYGDYARARAAADRVRALGFPQADVYDTRDFDDLAWGQLAVIADNPHTGDARKQATEAVRALRKQKLAPYAKPCHPTKTAAPITNAAGIRPLPTLSTEPAELDAGPGCFGWSPKEEAAACVTGRGEWSGSEWTLDFVGGTNPQLAVTLYETPERSGDATHNYGYREEQEPLPAKVRRSIERALKEGGYVVIPPARALAPGGVLHWAVPRFSVRWQRRVRSPAPGDHSDRIVFECGKGRAIEVFTADPYVGTNEREVNVYAIPGGRHVVLETKRSFGSEGEYGADAEARVIDLSKDCQAEPAPATP